VALHLGPRALLGALVAFEEASPEGPVFEVVPLAGGEAAGLDLAGGTLAAGVLVGLGAVGSGLRGRGFVAGFCCGAAAVGGGPGFGGGVCGGAAGGEVSGRGGRGGGGRFGGGASLEGLSEASPASTAVGARTESATPSAGLSWGVQAARRVRVRVEAMEAMYRA